VFSSYPVTYFLDSRLLDGKIARLEKTVQEFRDKFTESQRTAFQEKNGLNKSINSLRTRDESSSASISTKAYVSLTFNDH